MRTLYARTLTISLLMILTISLVLTSGPDAGAQTTEAQEKVCLTEGAFNDRIDREVRYECGILTQKAEQRDEAVAGEREAEKKLAKANGRVEAFETELDKAHLQAIKKAEEAARQKARVDSRWSTASIVLTAIGSALAGALGGFLLGVTR